MKRSSGAMRLPIAHGAIVGSLAAAALGLLALFGAFTFLDLKLNDWRYSIRRPQRASSRLALIEVDDATIAAYKRWPLPRESFALLIDALEQAGASAVGFDVLFLEEAGSDRDGDRLLAAMTARSDRVVHAMGFLPADPALGAGASPASEKLNQLVRHGRPVSSQHLAPAQRVALPYDQLLEAAPSLGHTALLVDRDGVVRRVPPFVSYEDWAYPSLAFRLIEIAARRDSTLPQFELDRDCVRVHWHGRRTRVPTDAEGGTTIVYAGDSSMFAQRYSMLRVLQWYKARDTLALARAFGDKMVLVGATGVSQASTDLGPTPFSPATPLVYVHANVVNAALGARFLVTPSRWLLLPLLLALGAAIGALLSPLSLGASALAAGGALAILAGLDYVLFAYRDVSVPSSALLFLPPLAWIGVEGYRRVVGDRAARANQKALEVARSIQRGLLPSQPPAFEGTRVFGANLPTEAIGGDYYDWLVLDEDTLAVIVADVEGHGVPAALLMSHLRATFHAEARPGRSAREIVGALNHSLTHSTNAGRTATCALALISRREARLSYCSAGHPPMYLVRNDLDQLLSTGIPLGIMESLEWSEEERTFEPGDVLVLYSDGVPERERGEELFGYPRWQEEVLRAAREMEDPAQMGQVLLDRVDAFAGGESASDDVTLVVVRRQP